jgi:chemotaxis protein histidine kinase CheA
VTAIDLSANEREAALQAFAAEAQETLAGMEGALIALEARPGSGEVLDGLLQSVARLGSSAGRASFATVRDLTADLAALIGRLRASGDPPGPEHLRLFHRALVALVESTADGVTGVSAPRPEVAALREQLAGAAPLPDAPDASAGYPSIDLALRSIVAETATVHDAGPEKLDPDGSPAPMEGEGGSTAERG